MVFVNESGRHPGIGPLRGWAPVGQILSGPEQPYARGRHVSIIRAKTQEGITASVTVDGGVKTEDLLRFVEQRLIPT